MSVVQDAIVDNPQRVNSPLNRLLQIAQETGANINELERRYGEQTFLRLEGTSHNRVQFFSATEEIINSVNMPDIGVQIGTRFRFNGLGMLGHAMISSADLAQAISTYLKYRDAFGSIFQVTSRLSNRGLLVTADIQAPMENAQRCLLENWITTWSHLPELLSEDRQVFTAIHIPLDEPHYSETFRSLFKCPVHFNSKKPVIHIRPDVIHIPLKYANRGVFQRCEAECAFARKMMGTSNNIEHSVARMFYESDINFPSAAAVARALGLSCRTLRRRLAERGTSLSRILQTVRMERAGFYQREGRLPAKRVAHLLGYSSVQSYQRAYKAFHGTTPQAAGKTTEKSG